MRSVTLAILIATSSMGAVDAHELVTASRAILCLNPSALGEANRGDQSQQSLRRLQCLRTEAGIPSTLLSDFSDSVWQVAFRPEGISAGVKLWAKPAAFTEPDGAPVFIQKVSR